MLRRAITNLISVVAVVLASTIPAAAQPTLRDKVTLRTPGGGRITQSCRIVDYDGETLTIQLRTGGNLRRYPASQVVQVQTAHSSAHVRGIAALKSGRFAEAETALQAALKQEERAWVRRDVLALLVRAALGRGEYLAAGSRFALLSKSDPQTRHFHLIPLVWTPRELAAAERGQARSWLADADESVRLIGAALLLRDPQNANAARTALDRLSVSGDKRIRTLAQAQSWRLRLATAELRDSELVRWESRIEQMPETLRGGPYYLLGRGRARIREWDRTAAALLWVPLVYDHDRYLAARAQVEAAEALVRAGQRPAAARLCQEVSVRFPRTPFAREAADLLKSLTPKGDKSKSSNRARVPTKNSDTRSSRPNGPTPKPSRSVPR